jgi:hypothetical protein
MRCSDSGRSHVALRLAGHGECPVASGRYQNTTYLGVEMIKRNMRTAGTPREKFLELLDLC